MVHSEAYLDYKLDFILPRLNQEESQSEIFPHLTEDGGGVKEGEYPFFWACH